MLPMAGWVVGFSLWNFILIKIVKGSVHRNLLNHPKVVTEIVRENIRKRDEEIERLEYEIGRLRYANEKLIQAVQNLTDGIKGMENGKVIKTVKKKKNA